MEGHNAPIQSLLLHGSVIADTDISAYRDVLNVLRAADVTVAFTTRFHSALAEMGLGDADDTACELHSARGVWDGLDVWWRWNSARNRRHVGRSCHSCIGHQHG